MNAYRTLARTVLKMASSKRQASSSSTSEQAPKKVKSASSLAG